IITVEDTTKPVATIDSAKQDGQELIGVALNAVQGTVEITVSASDNCATLSAPTVTVTDADNDLVDVTGTATGTGPWTYTYTINPGTANGTATISAVVSDGCNSSDAATATVEINKNQITGTVSFDTLST